jgi:hypothetical protein
MGSIASTRKAGRLVRSAAVVLAASLGAAFGDLLLTALVSSEASGLIAIAIAVPLMLLASRFFLEPLSNGVRKAVKLAPAPAAPDAPRGPGLWALGLGCGVLFGWAANVLGDFTQSHLGTVLATILASVAVVGSTTLAWLVGARSAIPLAGVLGALTGFVVNTLATVAVFVWFGQPVSLPLLEASAASGLTVGLSGLAGGLVIDVGRARRPALAAPLAALFVFAVTAWIGGWLRGNLGSELMPPNVMLGLGWLLGLSNSPYADALLQRSTGTRAEDRVTA